MRDFIFLLLATASMTSCAERAEPGTTERNPASRGVILQYHHVDATTPAVTSTRPDRFREHMDYLDDAGYRVWPVERLVDHVRRNEMVPDRVVAITFDDAYDSIYTTAFPILQRKGWQFTIFVSTEFLGVEGYLDWNQLREMKDAGATLANHTHSHTHLLRRLAGESTPEWRKRITDEIVRTQALLDEHLGETPRLLAYPYGEYNRDIVDIVEELDYIGFGQQSGAIGPNLNFAFLPRFPMGGTYNEMEGFKTKVDTLPLPITPLYREPLLTHDFTPSLPLEFQTTDLRLDQLVCYGPTGGKTKLERQSPTTYVATSETEVPVGRSRYNCTMPSNESGRFYWYSQMWIRKRADGTWYPEP